VCKCLVRATVYTEVRCARVVCIFLFRHNRQSGSDLAFGYIRGDRHSGGGGEGGIMHRVSILKKRVQQWYALGAGFQPQKSEVMS
jgi:hypothetical protein